MITGKGTLALAVKALLVEWSGQLDAIEV